MGRPRGCSASGARDRPEGWAPLAWAGPPFPSLQHPPGRHACIDSMDSFCRLAAVAPSDEDAAFPLSTHCSPPTPDPSTHCSLHPPHPLPGRTCTLSSLPSPTLTRCSCRPTTSVAVPTIPTMSLRPRCCAATLQLTRCETGRACSSYRLNASHLSPSPPLDPPSCSTYPLCPTLPWCSRPRHCAAG